MLQLFQNPGSIVRRLACAAALLWLSSPLSSPGAFAADEAPPPTAVAVSAEEAEREAIERLLDRRMTCDYTKTPLRDVLSDMAKVLGIEIQLAQADLEAEGIEADLPITLHVRDVTVRSGLNLVLGDELPLALVIEDGALSITSASYADNSLDTRVYDVSDLVIRREETGELVRDESDLLDIIQFQTGDPSRGPWIRTEGDGGEMLPLTGGDKVLFSVRQTQAVHREVAALLQQLRRLRHAAEPELTSQGNTEAAIAAALERRIDFDFQDQPLTEVIERLAATLNVNFAIEKVGLAVEGVELDTPINFQAQQLVAREGIELLIRKHGLPIALLVENEAAQIVTEARAGMTRTAAVYDVSDLVWHVDAEGVRVRDASQLIDTILSLTGGAPEGPWWDTDGEQVNLLALQSAGLDVLAIYQTQAVHRQIRQLLADMRRQRPLEFPSAVQVEQALVHSEAPDESAVSECRIYDVADLVVVRTPAVLTHQPWGGGGFFRVPSPLPLSGLQTHMQESVLATLKQQAQTYLALFNRSGRPSTIKKPVPPKQVEPPQPAVQTPPSTPARSVVETDFDALLLLMDEFTPAAKKPVSVVNSSAVKSLATRRTPGEHREIARLLAALRACRDTGRADWSAPLPAASPAALHTRLERTVSIDADDQPLQELLDSLEKRLDLKIVVDFAKPPAAGEGLESAVTLHVRDVPARDVLDRLARHLGLPWHVAEEAVILGRPAVGNGLTVAVYDVGELVVTRDAAGALQTDFEPLLDAILQQTGTADYGDWSQPREVGGKILPFSAMGIHAVVVRQVPEVHVQISQLLTAFRRQCHARPGETDWRPSTPAGASAPAEPPGGKPGAPAPKPAGPKRV